MKRAFSLLELIFAIIVIGIIASFAIPKYMNTKDNALASTIKRDLVTVITSIQSYYLVNQDIENISDAVIINKTNWEIEDKKMIFKDKEHECLTLVVEDESIKVTIDASKGKTCKLIEELGVKNEIFELI